MRKSLRDTRYTVNYSQFREVNINDNKINFVLLRLTVVCKKVKLETFKHFVPQFRQERGDVKVESGEEKHEKVSERHQIHSELFTV